MKPNDIIEEKVLYKGPIFELKQEKVVLPNEKIAIRDVVDTKDAVAVIAVTNDDKVVFVKQYRHPIKKDMIELPAGLIEDGEDPKLTAIRELEEETGYKTNDIKLLKKFYTSPGSSTTQIYLYKAGELEKTSQNLDEEEFIEIIEVDKNEIHNLEIEDIKTLYGLTFL